MAPLESLCKDWEERTARLLVESGAVILGEFKLSSGEKSDIYIDARSLLGNPVYFKEIASLLVEVFLKGKNRLNIEAVIGVATGGIPWATALGLITGLPIGYVRPKVKGHGLSRIVEGVKPPLKVALVDDVATTGGSLSSAITALRSAGFTVEDALVIVDREQGASERLRKMGIALRPLTKLSCIRRMLQWTTS